MNPKRFYLIIVALIIVLSLPLFSLNAQSPKDTITAATPDFSLDVVPASNTVCAPDLAEYTLQIGQVLSHSLPIYLDATGYPPNTTPVFNSNPVFAPITTAVTISNTLAGAAGHYNIQISASDLTHTHLSTVALNLFTDIPGQVALIMPSHESVNISTRPTFSWNPSSQEKNYTLEVATDLDFTDIVYTVIVTQTNHTITTALSLNTSYFWRVRPDNSCGLGEYSEIFSFNTHAEIGQCGIGSREYVIYNEDFEDGTTGWYSDGFNDTWTLSSNRVNSGLYAYYAENNDSRSDQKLYAPSIFISPINAAATLQFSNYQDMESKADGCYDGAILELSTDGGSTWTQLDSQLLNDPYDGKIYSANNNPLGGVNGWCGNPQDWLNSMVDLSDYSEQTLNFRFRLGTDSSVGDEGWYIDDVRVKACEPIPDYDLAVIPASQTLKGVPNEVVAYQVSITNTDSITDLITATIIANTWTTVFSEPTGTINFPQITPLAPGQSITIFILVTVDANALADDEDVAIVRFDNGNEAKLIELTTIAKAVYDVDIGPNSNIITGDPGEAISHSLSLTNTSNTTESFNLYIDSFPNNWNISVPSTVGPLEAGEKTTVVISATVPNNALAYETEFMDVYAYSPQSYNSDSAELTTVVNAVYGVDINAAYTMLEGSAGKTITHTIIITNLGNISDTFDIVSTGVWASTPQTPIGPLDVGESRLVDIAVHIPSTANVNDTDSTTVKAISQVDTTTSATTTLTTKVIPYYAVEIATPAQAMSGTVGGIVSHTLFITNTGQALDSYAIFLSGYSWNTSLVINNTGLLNAGEGITTQVFVTIPSSANQDDSDAVTVTAFSVNANYSLYLTTTAIKSGTVEIRRHLLYLPLIFK